MLWSSAKDQTSFNAFRQHSGIDHGITLIEKRLGSCEFFTFGAEQHNSRILNFYFNHMDILWRHTFYFKDKGVDLIRKAQADRFILPRCNIANNEITIASLSDDLINQALRAAPIKRYALTMEGFTIYLTPSEAQCTAYVAQGKRLKEIGTLMKLSPRTVEVHLNHVKHKLFCSTTAEMIAKIQRYSNLQCIFN
jgi:DNA-binding CsgD family transcriptional regulator